MAQEEQRNSFLIYRTYIDVIENLEDEDALLMYQAISRYALDFQVPNLEGHLKNYWKLIKPNLDANIKKYYNAKKNRKKTKHEQKESKKKAYVDVNVDVNVDEDVNANGNFLKEINNKEKSFAVNETFTTSAIDLKEIEDELKIICKQYQYLDNSKLSEINKFSKSFINDVNEKTIAKQDHLLSEGYLNIKHLRIINEHLYLIHKNFLDKEVVLKKQFFVLSYEDIILSEAAGYQKTIAHATSERYYNLFEFFRNAFEYASSKLDYEVVD